MPIRTWLYLEKLYWLLGLDWKFYRRCVHTGLDFVAEIGRSSGHDLLELIMPATLASSPYLQVGYGGYVIDYLIIDNLPLISKIYGTNMILERRL